jgi:hypothetical protein
VIIRLGLIYKEGFKFELEFKPRYIVDYIMRYYRNTVAATAMLGVSHRP